jgi:glyoxylase-like metal-dependent hydrolase (beta-lactamase superfamily II)
MESGKMFVKQAMIGPMMNFVYLIGCAETKEAAVVDPAWDAQQILDLARDSGFNIRHILVTHSHPDHTNVLEPLLDATNAAVYIHREEVEYMRMVARNFGMSTDFLSNRAENIRTVVDGETVSVGSLAIHCIHTPGHSPGSLCFLVENSIFTGDTLFVDACGRVDMPGGDARKMWWSLNHTLKSLDDRTVVYPGHDYGGSPTSTIGEQKQSNPYMQYESVQQFQRDMM